MAAPAKRKRRLWDAYAFPGFRPEGTVGGIFGDPKARIIRLRRRSKKPCAAVVGPCTTVGMIADPDVYAIYRVPTRGSISNLTCDAFAVGTAAK
jgi:hypothetical protein